MGGFPCTWATRSRAGRFPLLLFFGGSRLSLFLFHPGPCPPRRTMWPFSSSGSDSAGPSSSASQSGAMASTSPPQESPTAYFSSESARFDQSRPAFDAAQAPSTQDFFANPSLDLTRLHPLAGLGKDEVEYLDIVDAQPTTLEGGRTALPSRGWSDDLCYGTGSTYLSGACACL